jgi:ribokinase
VIGHGPVVAVCGSLNMDVFCYVKRLPTPGETVAGERLAYTPGGKGANQAVAAARLGARVRFHGARGDDAFGKAVEDAMAADGIDVAGLAVEDVHTGVATITVANGGDNLIVAVSGANDRAAPPRPDAEAAVWLTDGQLPVAAIEGTLAAARATGATAIITPVPVGRVPRDLAARFDYAIVNERETDALAATGTGTGVVTMGARGLRAGALELPAIPAAAVDTTGAGDALTAGLAVGLAEAMALEQALRLGMAAAACVVERYGCQPAMPTRQEVEARL